LSIFSTGPIDADIINSSLFDATTANAAHPSPSSIYNCSTTCADFWQNARGGSAQMEVSFAEEMRPRVIAFLRASQKPITQCNQRVGFRLSLSRPLAGLERRFPQPL
jgi:hypothetical protein